MAGTDVGVAAVEEAVERAVSAWGEVRAIVVAVEVVAVAAVGEARRLVDIVAAVGDGVRSYCVLYIIVA